MSYISLSHYLVPNPLPSPSPTTSIYHYNPILVVRPYALSISICMASPKHMCKQIYFMLIWNSCSVSLSIFNLQIQNPTLSHVKHSRKFSFANLFKRWVDESSSVPLLKILVVI